MPEERNWVKREAQVLYTEPDLKSWIGTVADLRRDDKVRMSDQFCFLKSGDLHKTTLLKETHSWHCELPITC